MVLVNSVRSRRTQQGRVFYDAVGRNPTGIIQLKVWGEVVEAQGELKAGLWGITGRLETLKDLEKNVVAE